jgi:putative mRNA 3-end processing factor
LSRPDLIVLRPEGLYCPPGDFWIDPWRAVPRAVITHAHSDHARGGHGACLAQHDSAALLRTRLGDALPLQTLAYGERLRLGDVNLSLHPAGHVLGSAQVRIEHRGQVWVASGDYFLAGDHPQEADARPTCAPFEPVRCDCFITECTFGLPVYRWRSRRELMAEVQAWWQANAAEGRTSLLLGYSLGKAQRLLAGLDEAAGPIAVHGAVASINQAYQAAGVRLPATRALETLTKPELRSALVVAPPSVLGMGSAWAKRLGDCRDAFASGWMQLRGPRRRQGVDRGFALSDHADWPGLLRAIEATGCERVIVTHGNEAVLQRWLREQGLRCDVFGTEYGQGEEDRLPTRAAPAAPPGAPATLAGTDTSHDNATEAA